MDMKTAVIYRLEELIRQKDITVNEAATFWCSAINAEEYFVWAE